MSIEFNTSENKLIVNIGTEMIPKYISYSQEDKQQYLRDYPDRISDIIAMGW